jgi:hypothetical protein
MSVGKLAVTFRAQSPNEPWKIRVEPLGQLAKHRKKHAYADSLGKPHLLESQSTEDLPVHLTQQPIVCAYRRAFQFAPPRCIRKSASRTLGQSKRRRRPLARMNGIDPLDIQFRNVPLEIGTRLSNAVASRNPSESADNLVAVSASASMYFFVIAAY